MPTIVTRDGTEIYYKDWGSGRPVVFSHGWPLSADSWEAQMFFLASHGYRCIAHDRRGHGRSGQPWDGNEMDTYADDLAELIEALDLRRRDLVRVLDRWRRSGPLHRPARHGASRTRGADLGGSPADAEDRAQSRRLADRGVRRPARGVTRRPLAALPRPRERSRSSATTGQARRPRRGSSTRSGSRACRPATRTPTTASRRSPKRTSPRISRSSTCRRSSCTADDDQIVPIGCAALTSAKLIASSTLKVYPGCPARHHRHPRDQLNADLLSFLRGELTATGVPAEPAVAASHP